MRKGLLTLFEQPTTRLFVTLLVEALEPGSPIRDRYVAIHEALRGSCQRWLERFPLPAGMPTGALAAAIVGSGSASTSSGWWRPTGSTWQSLTALHTLLPGR